MQLRTPIFPLNISVLPQEFLPLHIFEDRYKRMVSKCIEDHTKFGIVYQYDDKLANIGCLVSINSVLKEYDDGKYDIVVKGSKRFEIINLNKKYDLWYGDIDILNEHYDLMNKQYFSKVLDKYLQFLLSLNIEGFNIQNEMDKNNSFDFTKNVIIPNEIKQEFLELKDEEERMFFIDTFLDSAIKNSKGKQKIDFKDQFLN